MIKPYIHILTPSEIHVVMASGYATVSGKDLVPLATPLRPAVLKSKQAFLGTGLVPTSVVHCWA